MPMLNFLKTLTKIKENKNNILELSNFKIDISEYYDDFQTLKEIKAIRIYFFLLIHCDQYTILEIFHMLFSRTYYQNNVFLRDSIELIKIRDEFHLNDNDFDEIRYNLYLFFLFFEFNLIKNFVKEKDIYKQINIHKKIYQIITTLSDQETILDTSKEEALKRLEFIDLILSYGAFPKERPSNKFLDIVIFQINNIAKKNNVKNNLEDFTIPILKRLKNSFPNEFENLTSFDKSYILRRISEGKSKKNLFF